MCHARFVEATKTGREKVIHSKYIILKVTIHEAKRIIALVLADYAISGFSLSGFALAGFPISGLTLSGFAFAGSAISGLTLSGCASAGFTISGDIM